MGRAVLQLTLFWLLLTLAASLPIKDNWDIRSFHINSTVSSRYATTVITSRVTNSRDESKEIEFHVQIPKNAFISKFRMFVDDDVFDGVVKTKEQAQQQYTQAVSRGQSAGIVSSVGRTMEEFKTSVTVAAHKKVTFELTYEELLKRTHGKYELQIHARPMQPVQDFKVDVYIYENAGIRYIDVKGGLSTKALVNAITTSHADKQAWVHFYPTVDQQKTCDSCGEQGMNGDLVIVYDVNRDQGLGDIKISNGYFVHHFAPSSLARIPKNIVFLIDESGSMGGRKIEQTQSALIHILNDLAEDDFFGLITFDSYIFYWKQELVQATSANLEKAKIFAQHSQAYGGTNINEAVLEGARMLNAHPREGSASILLLLTDGEPTTGESNPEIIQSNVRRAIAGKFPLYCLCFGFDVKFEFLEKISLENNGFARRIYEDSDADLQLKGFYDEIATPLLTDVTMVYVGGNNLTQTNFSQFYNGSEIVVAGQIIETLIPQVVAISIKSKITFSNTNSSVEPYTGTVVDGHIQRVWAYLTVKQLLKKALLLAGPDKEKAKKEALELSLKYGFVTPLTSMVVTKPQGQNTEPKEEKPSSYPYRYSSRWSVDPGYYQRSRRQNGRVIKNSSPSRDIGLGWSLLPNGSKISLDSGWRIDPSKVTLAGPTDNSRSVSSSGSVFHRLLLKSENSTLPLCFDINGSAILKLFHRPSSELYVNGELDSETNGGFKKIKIHIRTDQHVEVDTVGVAVREGHTETWDSGQGHIRTRTCIRDTTSLGVINGVNGVDVGVGGMYLFILVHEKNRHKFLWPVLKARPSVGNTEGILASKAAEYEEVPQSPTKLKIKDRVIDATRSTAHDYSVSPPVELNCWLISPDVALQRPLQDFFTPRI